MKKIILYSALVCASGCSLVVSIFIRKNSDDTCGNAILDADEACDIASEIPEESDGCAFDCRSQCNNGIFEPGEECEDGNLIDNDGCSSSCLFDQDLCGNGQIDAGEICDDADQATQNGCRESCTALCGNTSLEGTESCDDGGACSDNITQVCSSSQECSPGAFCVPKGNDGCSSICKKEICGDATTGVSDINSDGVLDLEDCDIGGFCSDNINLSCNEDVDCGGVCLPKNNANCFRCVDPNSGFCGDGFIQSNFESCDNGKFCDGNLDIPCSADDECINLGFQSCLGIDGCDEFCTIDVCNQLGIDLVNTVSLFSQGLSPTDIFDQCSRGDSIELTKGEEISFLLFVPFPSRLSINITQGGNDQIVVHTTEADCSGPSFIDSLCAEPVGPFLFESQLIGSDLVVLTIDSKTTLPNFTVDVSILP